MEGTGVIPEEIVEKFIEWSVDEVYDRWTAFALDGSIALYDHAIKQARKESDERTDQMREFIEDLIKAYNWETKKDSKDFKVYTPVKREIEDMR